jgi:flagellar hook-associated protein 2
VTSTRTGNPDNSSGLGNNPSDTGVDIAGTINGHVAVGSGLTLTGAAGQPEEGLSLAIAQTTTGSYGSATVTLGSAADDGQSIMINLRSALKGITDPLAGPIHNATDALNQNIKIINDQISRLEDRLTIQQQLLTAEYSRADQALRLMNVNQTSLTSQTNSLSAFAA